MANIILLVSFCRVIVLLKWKYGLAIPFAVAGLILLLIFPLLNKESIFEHYKRQVNEIYKNNFAVELRLAISDELIEIVDDATKTQIYLKQIDGVIETGNYLYVSPKKGGHIIIPKSKIKDFETVKNEFRSICGGLSVTYTEDLNWKW